MRIRKNKENEELDLDFIAAVSDALAHPARLKLFRYIMHENRAMRPVCNKDLVAASDYAQATISQHMRKLIASGLVETKKRSKSTYYYANLGVLTKYVDLTRRYSLD